MSAINNIRVGGEDHGLEAEVLGSPSGIDGVAFDGGSSITHYATCATATGTAAKSCALGNDFTLGAGARVSVKFSNTNTAANPTLSVNGSTAKAIMAYGTTPAGSGAWAAGETVTFEYDGTYWQMVGGGIAGTSTYGRVKMDAAPTSGSQNAPTSGGTFAALAKKADSAIVTDDFDASASYAVGDLVMYDGELYVCTTAHTGAWSAGDFSATTVSAELLGEVARAKAAEAALADELDTKANVDGYYEDLTAGNAEQLVSTLMVENKVPYLFRAAGGSADIGNRSYPVITGGSAAWNQLADVTDANVGTARATRSVSGTSVTFTENRTEAHASFGGSIRNLGIPAGRVVILGFDLTAISVTDLEEMNVYIRDASTPPANAASVGDAIATAGTVGRKHFVYKLTANAVDVRILAKSTSAKTGTTDTFTIDNVQITDVTQMYGSAVAEAKYALGADAFKAWYTGLYPGKSYPYNAGALVHVNTSAHKTVGFNLLNPDTGEAKLLGGYLTQITGDYTALAYVDVNGEAETITPDSDGHFTPSADGVLTVSGLDAATTCVHLVHSGYRDGEFEEYAEHNYPLDDSLTLRGIPKVDAGEVYYDGDVYKADGTVTRRYGVVDLGSLTWAYDNNNAFFNAPLSGARAEVGMSLICQKYVFVGRGSAQTLLNAESGTIYYYSSENYYSIRVKDTAYTASDLTGGHASWLDGVYLVYELATPADILAEPYQSPQIVDDFGTEEFIVTPAAGLPALPVGHTTQYPANLRDKLQRLPDIPDSTGDYLVHYDAGTSECTFSPFVGELPATPAEDGTYTLKVNVSGGSPTLAWALDS